MYRSSMPLLLLILAFVPSASAQESVGFSAPQDVGALLEYRLPDWGYRTWDAAFDFSGSGRDESLGGEPRIANSNRATLGSDLQWWLHGERRDQNLSVAGDGAYGRSHDGAAGAENRLRNVNGALAVSGGWDEYLGGGPFMLGFAASTHWRFAQRDRTLGGADETTDVSRRRGVAAGPRAGVGRVRDVVPLIRAKRLSERLVALGRPPLADDQVRAVAEVLAREHGYRTVFERPDRSFWRDVLEPMLGGESLSPYEIFYLRDVLVEATGYRAQGTALTCGADYTEEIASLADQDRLSVRRSAQLALTAYRNLTLHHQVHGQVHLRAIQSRYGSRVSDLVSPGLRLGHLWNVTDRYLLETVLLTDLQYEEAAEGITRNLQASLRPRLRIHVEDRMAVVADVALRFSQDEGADAFTRRGWSWSYGLGLEYALENLLY